MALKTNIKAALRLSDKAYDDYYFSNFYIWCEKQSAYQVPTRILVQNSALAKWYSKNWELVVEAPFYHANAEYIEAGVNAPVRFFELFDHYVETMLRYYPKVLLSNIKKEYKEWLKLDNN